MNMATTMALHISNLMQKKRLKIQTKKGPTTHFCTLFIDVLVIYMHKSTVHVCYTQNDQLNVRKPTFTPKEDVYKSMLQKINPKWNT